MKQSLRNTSQDCWARGKTLSYAKRLTWGTDSIDYVKIKFKENKIRTKLNESEILLTKTVNITLNKKGKNESRRGEIL
jgi:hypothetical protein